MWFNHGRRHKAIRGYNCAGGWHCAAARGHTQRDAMNGHACNGQKRKLDRVCTADPRTADPRTADPRTADPRTADPRTADPRTADPRTHARVDYTGRFCSSRASEQSNCSCPWPESTAHSSRHAHEMVQSTLISMAGSGQQDARTQLCMVHASGETHTGHRIGGMA
jgi:hypothetical protein